MPILVTTQANVFLWTVAGGIIIGIIYDFFRVLRKFFRAGSIAAFFEDLMFWIIVSLVLLLTLYISNDGEVRPYIFMGAAIGSILYFLTASPVLVKSMVIVVNLVRSGIRLLFKVLFVPLCLAGRIVGKPVILLIGKFMRVLTAAYRSAVFNAGRLFGIRKAIWKIRRKI